MRHRHLIYFVLYLCSTPAGLPYGVAAETAVDVQPPTLFVASIENQTGKPKNDIMAQSAGEILAVVLSGYGCQVVERRHLPQALQEQMVTLALGQPNHLVKTGELVHADYVITGSILDLEKTYTLIIQTYHLDSATLINSQKHTFTPSTLPQHLGRIAQTIYQNLQVKWSQPTDTWISLASDTHLEQGLGYYCMGHFDRAIMHFMKHLHTTPSQTIAHYWMSLCYDKMGELEHADIEMHLFLNNPSNQALAQLAQKHLKQIHLLP